MMQMSVLKVALLGATIIPLAACSQLGATIIPLAACSQQTRPVVSASQPAQAPSGGIIATLDAYAASARATQPNWPSPLGR
jgi:hypothetical protein